MLYIIKMTVRKKIVITSFILLFIGLLVYIFSIKSDSLNLDNNSNSENKNLQTSYLNSDVEKNLADLNSNKRTSKEVPEKYLKYDTLTGFVKDRNKLLNEKDINLDLLEDNFVVCSTGENWNITYTPIYNQKIKEWEYSIEWMRYDYMKIIDEGINSNCIYWGKWTKWIWQILFEEDVRHPLKKTIDDIFNRRKNVFKLLEEMESVKNKTKKYSELQAYLYDFVWQYDKAKKIREEEMEEKEYTQVSISWIATDWEWNPLSNVAIVLLNNSQKKVKTNEEWKYKMEIKAYPLSHLRFKASKEWYADGFFSVYLDHSQKPSWDKKIYEKFVLNKAGKIYNLDFTNQDKIETVGWKDYYVIESSQSIYHVPVRKLYYKDWTKFEGDKLKVYLYEFKKTDDLENLTEVDTFSPVLWYVWNLMKTFWMPYIQFFDENWKEVFVKKSQPMLLINDIYHMEALYENQDQIYEAITTGDMKQLVAESRKWGYPITYDWLIEHDFLKWPAWWYLDREKWTWVSVPHKVIDKSWVVQLKFWQIKQ